MLRSRLAFASALLVLSLGRAASAAPATEVVRANLPLLIEHAAPDPGRFAVNLAHRTLSETDGRWTYVGARAVWRYAFRVPTATTVSFHASRLTLPQSALLTLTAGGVTYEVRRADLGRASFWSRVGRGDTMTLELSVDRAERRQALLEIDSVQAGYRGLVRGMADHPAFQHWAAVRHDSAMACVENYACHVTNGNEGNGAATVALVVANQYGCTGTLLNDVPEDGEPYVATARHCENGQAGGGNPGAAADVTVYWNANTACGTDLGSIFSTATPVQSGAVTVVEQEDAWLIRLDLPPKAPNAYFAGWNATGAPLTGGYTIHHANLLAAQYVGWSGAAVRRVIPGSTFSVGYSGTFWEVVNAVGSLDVGGSGAALYTPNDRLAGLASRALPGRCPLATPPAPSDANAVAYFESLSAVWSSLEDATSTTGSATFAAALDPASTGIRSIDGVSGLPPSVSVTASQLNQQVGSAVDLEFEIANSDSCTANGGASGDGWSGAIATSAVDQTVTESSAGTFTYGLRCTKGARSATSSVTVRWTNSPPRIVLYDASPPFNLYAGAPNQLAWTSNASVCTATGGTPGDGWGGAVGGSGSVAVTEEAAGSVTYTLSCRTGSQSTLTSLTLVYAPPTATLAILGQAVPTLRVGEPVTLLWNGIGGCTASGGQAGDGWAGVLPTDDGALTVTSTTGGTITYGLACGPATSAVTASVSQVYTTDPPSATLTAPTTSPVVDVTETSTTTSLAWTSNVEPCSVDFSGPASGNLVAGYPAVFSTFVNVAIAGTYTYTLTCGSGTNQASSSATVTWIQPAPQVTLSIPPALVLGGQYFAWTTNVLPCVGSGGTAGDGWDGPLAYGNATVVTETVPGAYTYTLTCGVGPVGTASATVVFTSPGGSTLTLNAASDHAYVGQSVPITWSAAVGPCTGSGGAPTDGWNGPQPMLGSATVAEAAGTYTYTLVCGSGGAAVEAQAQITFTNPAQVVVSTSQSASAALLGSPVTLGWVGSEAASCRASGGLEGDGWTGTRAASGSAAVTEAVPGPATYTITCTNGALSGQGTFTVNWIAPPTASLTASPASVAPGGTVTLSWSSTNADHCSASSDDSSSAWSGPETTSGSVQVNAPSSTGSATYALLCTGPVGGTDESDATVEVLPPPTVTLNASPATVVAGTPTSLSWTSNGATQCTAEDLGTGDGWTGTEPTSSAGVAVTEATAGSYVYAISCQGTGGTTRATANVTVTTPAVTAPTGASSGGGGGDFDALALASLALLALGRSRRVRDHS